MATTSTDRSEWSRLTDRLSADSAGHDVSIEVLDPSGGDNPLVDRLPFGSITYAPKDDVLVVSVGGGAPDEPVVLRHLVAHPQELVFDLVPHGAALKVTDAAGGTTLVSLLRRGAPSPR